MNREEWLNRAAAEILKKFDYVFDLHFEDEGRDHLDSLLVSTGFPSRGGLTKVIGECWRAEASEKGGHHIFINPRLTDIVEVIATLAHMGLEGKPTATFAGPEFAEWATVTAATIGEYPHEKLIPISAQKKQSNRQLKAKADCCGYVIRLTKKWAEVGMPSCPCGNEFELE